MDSCSHHCSEFLFICGGWVAIGENSEINIAMDKNGEISGSR